jgi:hypothetical protein
MTKLVPITIACEESCRCNGIGGPCVTSRAVSRTDSGDGSVGRQLALPRSSDHLGLDGHGDTVFHIFWVIRQFFMDYVLVRWQQRANDTLEIIGPMPGTVIRRPRAGSFSTKLVKI